MKCKIPPDFPRRIKQLRVKLGLTQMRLAELMGGSPASVYRWETNTSIQRRQNLSKVTEKGGDD